MGSDQVATRQALLVDALLFALTAPDDQRCDEAVVLANILAKGLVASEVEEAKVKAYARFVETGAWRKMGMYNTMMMGYGDGMGIVGVGNIDPDAVLARVRELIAAGDSAELVEAFESLDGWLSWNGRLPRDWVGGYGQ